MAGGCCSSLWRGCRRGLRALLKRPQAPRLLPRASLSPRGYAVLLPRAHRTESGNVVIILYSIWMSLVSFLKISAMHS